MYTCDGERGPAREVVLHLASWPIFTLPVISESTVKSHIANIHSRLYVADRTQAAVYAWQEGIVRREQR